MSGSDLNLSKELKQLDRNLKQFKQKYSVVEDVVLGKGHFCKVYLGQLKRNNTAVAIKKMIRENLSEKGLGQIRREVGILQSLQDHPNIVKLFDYYETRIELFLVMEYVDGGDLYDKIAVEGLEYSEETVQKIIRVLSSALNDCLAKGIIHRDVKPHNILLTKKGDLKLADFNLSIQVNPEQVNENILDESCGTLNYVAPEVLRNNTFYNYKCDVWSLGVVGFVLLSGGYTPFIVTSEDIEAYKRKEKVKGMKNLKKKCLQMKVCQGDWDFEPEEEFESVTDLGKSFLRGMLEKSPEKRFSYDQILNHPWIVSKNLPQDSINHEVLDKEIYARRLALKVQKMDEAIAGFASALQASLMESEKVAATVLESGDNNFRNLGTSLDDILNL